MFCDCALGRGQKRRWRFLPSLFVVKPSKQQHHTLPTFFRSASDLCSGSKDDAAWAVRVVAETCWVRWGRAGRAVVRAVIRGHASSAGRRDKRSVGRWGRHVQRWDADVAEALLGATAVAAAAAAVVARLLLLVVVVAVAVDWRLWLASMRHRVELRLLNAGPQLRIAVREGTAVLKRAPKSHEVVSAHLGLELGVIDDNLLVGRNNGVELTTVTLN